MIVTCKSDVYLWPDRLLGRSVTFLALFLCTFYELCCTSPSAGAPVSLGCDSVIRGELWGCLDPTFLWISTQLKFYCFRGSVEAESKRTCSTMFNVWCHRVRLRLILWEPVLFFFFKGSSDWHLTGLENPKFCGEKCLSVCVKRCTKVLRPGEQNTCSLVGL